MSWVRQCQATPQMTLSPPHPLPAPGLSPEVEEYHIAAHRLSVSMCVPDHLLPAVCSLLLKDLTISSWCTLTTVFLNLRAIKLGVHNTHPASLEASHELVACVMYTDCKDSILKNRQFAVQLHYRG
eukprot:754990-Hanusia_phi.AAC.2